jgi:isocitrate dehydrogenase
MFSRLRLFKNNTTLASNARRLFCNTSVVTNNSSSKLVSPPLVVMTGEEMTRYAMQLILDQWIYPHIDTSKWEVFDLSCKSRDDTKDRVLVDAINAGKKICSIFKEPTITPSAAQVKEMGLKKAWGSPNGAMRKGWNGISISRDTIHIPGVKLGYEKQVIFDRHAVGGEYGAGWKQVGSGRVVTSYFPEDNTECVIVDDRTLSDKNNVVVTYHNPLDNVHDLAHHFFKRCLNAKVTPYVVTKKTVFKWQEGFWVIMKKIYDEHYKTLFVEHGIVSIEQSALKHLISDSATMQIVRWTKGGFGMVSHNYDGDMLTDEISQVHRSPGFITSTLIGKTDTGTPIKGNNVLH